MASLVIFLGYHAPSRQLQVGIQTLLAMKRLVGWPRAYDNIQAFDRAEVRTLARPTALVVHRPLC